ncbi:hypothetical protein DFH09DRAFT_1332983 [Mycena vulgaris]|nr:hypothetical protein DFH09DRAFT_1332983 [Mycena vulgaris]
MPAEKIVQVAPESPQTAAESPPTPAETLARLSGGCGPTSSVAQAQYRLYLVTLYPIRAGARILELGYGREDTTPRSPSAAMGTSMRSTPPRLTTVRLFPLPSPLLVRAKDTGQAQATISDDGLGARIAWAQAEPLAFLDAHPDARWDVPHSLKYFGSPAHWSLDAGVGGKAGTHVLAVVVHGALECRKPGSGSEANMRTVVPPLRIKGLAAAWIEGVRTMKAWVPVFKSGEWETVPTKSEEVALPPTNEDGGTGSSGSCVVCKEDTALPPMNEDGGTGSSGSCVIA